MGEPAIKKALQLEDIFTKDEIERRKYEIRERALRDYYSDMKTNRDEGIKEGRVKVGGNKERGFTVYRLAKAEYEKVKEPLNNQRFQTSIA